MTDLLRVLIVDDEAPARRILSKLLMRHCEGTYAVTDAATLEEASVAILANHPDLIFLDVELRGATGFDLLAQVDLRDTQVVFVTAYAEYAVDAFRVAATDYLVKPVEIEQLKATLARVRARAPRALLSLPGTDGRRLVPHDEVVAIEADGSYSTVCMESGERVLVVRKLGQFEGDLAAGRFFRCHRSYLVNLSHLRQVRTGAVELSNGMSVPVSRSRRAALNAHLRAVS